MLMRGLDTASAFVTGKARLRKKAGLWRGCPVTSTVFRLHRESDQSIVLINP
jgi:hypothetical protein